MFEIVVFACQKGPNFLGRVLRVESYMDFYHDRFKMDTKRLLGYSHQLPLLLLFLLSLPEATR